jgi:hypothetical protein
MRIEAKFKNWEKHQAKFNEKRPGDEKWRKMHRSFFSDYHVRKLSEQDRFKLMALISFAELSTGVIDFDHDELCYEIGCKSFDISKFGHFVEITGSTPQQNAAGSQQNVSELQQNVCLDKIRLDQSIDNKPHRSKQDQVGVWFDQFWKSYPKKISRSKAIAKFEKIISSGVKFDDIMHGLDASKNSRQWTKDGGQFIPHPTTWLNNERWRDEDTGNNNLTGEVPRMEGLGL